MNGTRLGVPNGPGIFKVAVRFNRLKKSMTQEALGAECGVSGKSICLYELGKAVPNPTTFMAMEKALGVKLPRPPRTNARTSGYVYSRSRRSPKGRSSSTQYTITISPAITPSKTAPAKKTKPAAIKKTSAITSPIYYRTIYSNGYGGVSLAARYNARSKKTEVAMSAISPTELFIDSKVGEMLASARLAQRVLSAKFDGNVMGKIDRMVITGIETGAIRPNAKNYRDKVGNGKAIKGPLWWEEFKSHLISLRAVKEALSITLG